MLFSLPPHDCIATTFISSNLSILKMAHNPSYRTTRRASCAHSIRSEDSYATTARPSPPVTRRHGTRAVRADSIASDAINTLKHTSKAIAIPTHYTFPPTVPSPFAGTLEASLDAILEWG